MPDKPEQEITPDSSLVKYSDKSLERRKDGNYVYDVASNEQQFNAMLKFAENMVKTGFLPQAIKTPAQAVAVILTGREIGLAPMQALRSIQVIQGKPCLSAELQLAKFKEAGGRANWIESSNEKAVLELIHPNGDKHVETWTLDDAKKAGLLSKEIWSKYPKAMLRARAISAGIRAIAPDIGMGVYDPEEFGSTPPLTEIKQVEAEPVVTQDEPAKSTPHGFDPTVEDGTTESAAFLADGYVKEIADAKSVKDLIGIKKRMEASKDDLGESYYAELLKSYQARLAVLQSKKEQPKDGYQTFDKQF